MIKANELRVGNIVLRDGKEYCIESLDIKYGELRYPDNIEPVPLTEEWLVKMGFTIYLGNKHIYETEAHGEFFSVNKDKEGLDYSEGFLKPEGFYVSFYTYYDDVVFDKFYYAHQIQNLYHALRGEELEIKKADNNKEAKA